ncbi:GNAT family N-acetyltransferase [Saccharopolyspora erythraea]|uniref:GNAT family N-acetyltransferase n=1 Tax=Saccharopolyspora erythraea TaxID=1836 RepID=UPI002012903D|nr:GNAT family N-acetyltransferase [Saccharopolyspora erythraea]
MFSAAEVVSIARAGHPAMVAVVQQDVVGMAAAKVEGERAWLAMFALDARWRNRGIGSALLGELEKKLRGQGVHRITSLVPEGAAGFKAMVNCGYRPRTDLTYFEKVEDLDPADFGVLEELGGQLLPPGRWDALAGMTREKDVIERLAAAGGGEARGRAGPPGGTATRSGCPPRASRRVRVAPAGRSRPRAMESLGGRTRTPSSVKILASGLPIASVLFPSATVGLIVLPVMLYHLLQLVVCAVLARRRGASELEPIPVPAKAPAA